MPTTQTTPAPVFLPVPVEPSPPPPVPRPAGEQLLAAWLSGRAETTVAAYRADLRHFAAFAGTPGRGRRPGCCWPAATAERTPWPWPTGARCSSAAWRRRP